MCKNANFQCYPLFHMRESGGDFIMRTSDVALTTDLHDAGPLCFCRLLVEEDIGSHYNRGRMEKWDEKRNRCLVTPYLA